MNFFTIFTKVAKRTGTSSFFAKILYPFLTLTKKGQEPQENPTSALTSKWPDNGHSSLCQNVIDNPPAYDIEVIIPVYNTADTVEEAINSTLQQKGDFKLLIRIIDDGSTDGSAKLVDKYLNYPNVEIIHQENKGHSGARNTALKHINATYIFFLDSDDKLSESALEKLITTAKKYDADIVQGSYETIDMKGNIRRKNILPTKLNGGKMLGFPWGKLIKSEKFRTIQFPEGYWFEDSIMSIILHPLTKSEKKISISDIVYQYRVNPKGITATARKNIKVVDSLWVTQRLYEDRIKMGKPLTPAEYEQFLHQCSITLSRVASYGNPEITDLTFQVLRHFKRTYFPDIKTPSSNKRYLHKFLNENKLRAFQIISQLI